jgi:hypothetical protein
MSQIEMFKVYVGRPIFVEPFEGMVDHMTLIFVVLLTGLAMAASSLVPALDLFSTPSLWWQGLGILVGLDWVAGVVTSFHRGTFDARELPRKWYQLAGYFIVCGAVAILSNQVIHELGNASLWSQFFYHAQFAIYISFGIKEFVSILKTFRMLTFFMVMWEIVSKKNVTIDSFRKLLNEIDRRRDQLDEQ